MKNGKITINITISEKKYFVSKYNDEVISNELVDHIQGQLIGEDTKKDLQLNIETKFKLTEQEKDTYTYMLKKEYKERVNDILIESRDSDIKKLILFVVGLLFISGYYFLDLTFSHIISEVLLIFGWVAMWEVAYSLLFLDFKRKKYMKRYNQILKCDVKYNEDIENDNQ